MADNVTLNAMTGGAVVSTDDVGSGVQVQRVKVQYGSDGSATDVDATHGLPTDPVALSSAVTSAAATVSTAGTRVQLASHACKTAVIRAKLGNTGIIYVGGSTVDSTNGLELAPGDALPVDVANTNLLYIDAATSGDSVRYLWVS